MNMRRAPSVEMIQPGIRSWLNGKKPVFALVVGEATSGARKIAIKRRVMLINRMQVAPRGVGLPDFYQGIGHRTLVLVHHFANDNDTLAHGLLARSRIARQIILS